MIARARWYWDRLRAMSPEEMRSRGELAWRKREWRRREAWRAPVPAFCTVPAWELPLDLAADAALFAEAEAYMRGEYRLLNLDYRETTPDWHKDPQTGRRTPLSFGPDIDYRKPSIAGNVKNTWEKNRHHHLTVLALAFALTRDERYAAEVDRQLRDWVQNNPFPRGINWTSMLELGVRMISWVWIDRLLTGSARYAGLFGPQGVLWEPIYWHQWLMARCPSQGSSANNHLLGEVAGAYMAATAWPFYEESASWREHARQVLEREAALQTFESGLNREQAAAYHLFSLELFLLPAIEAERAGEPFSAAYKQWLGKMLRALPRMCDVAGHLPRFGDEDGGMAVQLRAMDAPRLDWLYELGRCFLGLALPGGNTLARLVWDGTATRAGNTPWVAAAKRFGDAPVFERPRGSEAFEDAGVYVLASDRGGPQEVLCLADAGPLGFLSIAGHGHADALSFALNAGGQPVVVDPGTYVYHAEPGWRAYFRGTRAHNTVTVDGQEQSVPRGPFLWGRRQARARALAWAPMPRGGRLLAEHDGYERLPGKVVHRREFTLDGTTLVLFDELEGSGTHQVEWRLHFDPGCEVSLEEGRCLVKWKGGHLSIPCHPRLTWRLARGEADGGWYSGGFNMKEPTYTLIGSDTMILPNKLEHTLSIHFD